MLKIKNIHYFLGNCYLQKCCFGRHKNYLFTWVCIEKKYPRIIVHKMPIPIILYLNLYRIFRVLEQRGQKGITIQLGKKCWTNYIFLQKLLCKIVNRLLLLVLWMRLKARYDVTCLHVKMHFKCSKKFLLCDINRLGWI